MTYKQVYRGQVKHIHTMSGPPTMENGQMVVEFALDTKRIDNLVSKNNANTSHYTNPSLVTHTVRIDDCLVVDTAKFNKYGLVVTSSVNGEGTEETTAGMNEKQTQRAIRKRKKFVGISNAAVEPGKPADDCRMTVFAQRDVFINPAFKDQIFPGTLLTAEPEMPKKDGTVSKFLAEPLQRDAVPNLIKDSIFANLFGTRPADADDIVGGAVVAKNFATLIHQIGACYVNVLIREGLLGVNFPAMQAMFNNFPNQAPNDAEEAYMFSNGLLELLSVIGTNTYGKQGTLAAQAVQEQLKHDLERFCTECPRDDPNTGVTKSNLVYEYGTDIQRNAAGAITRLQSQGRTVYGNGNSGYMNNAFGAGLRLQQEALIAWLASVADQVAETRKNVIGIAMSADKGGNKVNVAQGVHAFM